MCLILKLADLQLDVKMRTVHKAGREIALHCRKYQLLDHLLRNGGRTVTRAMLLEKVWNIRFNPKSNIVETHMSRLRAQIDQPVDRQHIHTVRHIGYRMSIDA